MMMMMMNDDDSYHIVDHYTDYVIRDEGSPFVDPWYQ